MVVTGRIAAPVHIQSSYSPGGANVHSIYYMVFWAHTTPSSPKWHLKSRSVQIGSPVFARHTGVTNTHRQTDGPQKVRRLRQYATLLLCMRCSLMIPLENFNVGVFGWRERDLCILEIPVIPQHRAVHHVRATPSHLHHSDTVYTVSQKKTRHQTLAHNFPKC